MLKISNLAKNDIANIWVYIAQQNVDSANKIIRSLMEIFILLEQNPKLGTSKSKILDNLYSFPFKNYLVFYSVHLGNIKIHRVIHSSRNQKGILENLRKFIDFW